MRQHFLVPLPGTKFFLSLVLSTFSNLLNLSSPFIYPSHGITFYGIISSLHLFIILSFVISLIISSFTPLAPRHFGWLLVWVATPLIHLFTPRQEFPPDIHLLSLDYFFCFRISFMFKRRLQFFHFLQEFLLRSSLLKDLLTILEHGSLSLTST